MNFIKIIASNEFINVRLFVKEKDCYIVLQSIRELHMNMPATDTNQLQVNMRRVRIADDKARAKKYPCDHAGNKLAEVVGRSFEQLANLKESFCKQTA